MKGNFNAIPNQLQSRIDTQLNNSFLNIKRERDPQAQIGYNIGTQIDNAELKKIASIIQSTFPTQSDSVVPKPLQYANTQSSLSATQNQTQRLTPALSSAYTPFTYSTNYSRHNRNHYSNYTSASSYGQLAGIGKTSYNYLKNNQSGYGIPGTNSIFTQPQIPLHQTQLPKAGVAHKMNVPEKAKYVIKDMPEMTVGNFLQDKGIQDRYLNNIKKKEEEKRIDSTGLNAILAQDNAEEKNNVFGENQSKSTTTATTYNNNNNIILQSKIVPSQIQNKSKMSISNTTIPSSSSSNNQEKKEDIPPMLQNYFKRAFERCKNEKDIEICQKSLLKVMENTVSQGDMYSRNWNDFPLPLISTNDVNDYRKINERNNQRNTSSITSTNHHTYNNSNNTNHNDNDNTTKSTGYFGSSSNHNDLLSHIIAYKPIIGTCTDLEKDYYRMTDHPEPSQVRPEYILKRSLKMLIDKWKNKTNDYRYISMQFRSLRQDLTVQLIQNEFAVKVYEAHARIALESYDLAQFNQCQTALIPLYCKGIKGKDDEFFAYRILYTSLFEKNEMPKIMSLINKKYKQKNYSMEINHAIKTLKALNEPNYFMFLHLYQIAPNKGQFLIEPFLPRLRIKALQVIAYGYYSEIPIEFVTQQLAFENMEECIKFLDENSLKRKDDKMLCKENINTLNSSQLLSALIVKKT